MEWIDLVAPSSAILALLGVIGLVVHAIRQGRVIRRLEERLTQAGNAAEEASLQRIAELQARHSVSEGTPSVRRQLRGAAALAVVVLVVLAGIAGVWFLVLRDEGAEGQAAGSDPPATTTTGPSTDANPPEPVDTTIVPENVPPLPDKTRYSVAVFNASGVTGAAGTVIVPALELEGYRIATFDDAPDGTDDRRESVVMWTKGNKRVAQNVAHDLSIGRAPPIDGLTSDHLQGADVAVIIGLDIANGTP